MDPGKLDADYIGLSPEIKKRVNLLLPTGEVKDIQDINSRMQVKRAIDYARIEHQKDRVRNDHELRFKGREKLLEGLRISETSYLNKCKSKDPRKEVDVVLIADVYPPSITPLAELKSIVLQQLKVDSHHRGKLVILRVISAGVMVANHTVTCIAEDQLKACTPCILFYQNRHRLPSEILDTGDVIIIKEPFVKSDDDGWAHVQIDHRGDIVFLAEDDPRFPKQWRVQKIKTAEQWKEEGNKLMQNDSVDYYGAIRAYTKALRASPNPEQVLTIRNNRALANLKIEAYDKVLEDTNFVAEPRLRSKNALHRGASAYYGLGDFKECLKVLEIAMERFPSKGTELEVKRVKLRLQEEKKDYKWATLYKSAEKKPPLIDCANFQGPIEVRPCAHGRGMFTTRPVKTGEVLLVEKAFVYCSREVFDESTGKLRSGPSTLVDLNNPKTVVFGLGSIFTEALSKLEGNPSLAPKFFDQYHGSYQPVAVAEVDGRAVLDTFLIQRIVALNSFAAPPVSKTVLLGTDTSPTYFGDPDFGTNGYSRGIWPLAARINHSCIPTCCRAFIGDVQIIRACNDLPANTEITFWYQPPSETAMTQDRLTNFWGFKCECAYCKDDEKTPRENMEKRQELINTFRFEYLVLRTGTKAQGKTLNDTADAMAKHEGVNKRWQELEGTYISPASDIPRTELFDLELPLVWWHLKVDVLGGVIFHGLRCLSSLGFVIEVSLSADKSESILEVKQWGLPLKVALGVWLCLWSAWGARGELGLERKARECAAKLYEIVMGEKETFIKSFGWLHEEVVKMHRKEEKSV